MLLLFPWKKNNWEKFSFPLKFKKIKIKINTITAVHLMKTRERRHLERLAVNKYKKQWTKFKINMKTIAYFMKTGEKSLFCISKFISKK